jgi:PRC-barrel domain protein
MIRLMHLGDDVLALAAAIPLLTGVPGSALAAAAPPKAGSAPVAAAPNPSPPPPANLEPLSARADTGILGKKIIGPDGTELGLVVDVVVDAQGHPHAAVIDFGGFLGVGSRKIAVDWRLLKLTPGEPDWKISLNISRAEIQGAPEYKPDAASNQMVGPPPPGPPSHDVDR